MITFPSDATPPENRSAWVYRGALVRVVDGDTVDIRVSRELDFGFRLRHELSAVMRFRLVGIDTPELTGPTKLLGRVAAHTLTWMLAGPLTVESLGEPDKYGGRWDGRILARRENGALFDVSQELIRLGYAKAYTGQGPRPTWDPSAPYPLEAPFEVVI